MEWFPSREILITIGTFSVHWYGVMYALAFALGIMMVPSLLRRTGLPFDPRTVDHLAFSVFLGVLLGGRLGFVLLYGDASYFFHPLRILAVWHGGMSSHGGFVGVAIALLLFSRKKGLPLLRISDAIVVPVAIGLMLGRIGNLINGELYGTVTDVPWALSFQGAEGTRHPTQIYAAIKNLSIACLCFIVLRSTYSRSSKQMRSGIPTAFFLIMYSIFRFILEYYRDQPYGFTSIAGADFSKGQLFTVPLLLLGVVMLVISRKSEHLR